MSEPLAKGPATRNAAADMAHTTARALVVLRVPHGAPAPDAQTIRDAIRTDRARLALPPDDGFSHRLAGPYPVLIGGEALDEYVAWEA
jgi:hypothetical protein